MKRVLFTAVATAAIAITAAPASATTIFSLCPNGQSCLKDETNVNLVGANDVTTVQGDVSGTSIDVAITGIGLGTGSGPTYLLDASHGLASVSMADGSLINSITFALLNGATFGSAEFNLLSGGKTPFTVTACTSDGNCNGVNLMDPQGSNFFDIIAPTGVAYTSATITAASGYGFTTFKQLGFDHLAVPEPATWAMMLLGFLGVGFVVSRERKKSAELLQLA